MGILKAAKAHLKDKTCDQDKAEESTPNTGESKAQDSATKGFLDIHPGDSFSNGRYTVKSQLGSGRYSSVWLAADKESVDCFLLLRK
jgi:hypothetical protein